MAGIVKLSLAVISLLAALILSCVAHALLHSVACHPAVDWPLSIFIAALLVGMAYSKARGKGA